MGEERRKRGKSEGESDFLSEENAENSSGRRWESTTKRVASWEGKEGEPLIREHRRNWCALTASKLKYISTTRREADALYAVIRERFFRAEMKGRYEEREFFINAESAYRWNGTAEGEPENHVHLDGVGAISREKWRVKGVVRIR